MASFLYAKLLSDDFRASLLQFAHNLFFLKKQQDFEQADNPIDGRERPKHCRASPASQVSTSCHPSGRIWYPGPVLFGNYVIRPSTLFPKSFELCCAMLWAILTATVPL